MGEILEEGFSKVEFVDFACSVDFVEVDKQTDNRINDSCLLIFLDFVMEFLECVNRQIHQDGFVIDSEIIFLGQFGREKYVMDQVLDCLEG